MSSPLVVSVLLMPVLLKQGYKGPSHATIPHGLRRRPLACPNSAPWCLTRTVPSAPPPPVLCSFRSFP